MVKFDLINNINEREIIMNEERLDVLDKVKELVFMEGTEYMTTQQVADYYKVSYEAIKSLVSRHKEELTKNGYKLVSGKELKEILVSCSMNLTNKKGYFECNGEKFANRSNGLFNKRSILNVGMLLRDGKVAKEVRSRLLDIEYESNKAVQENGQTIKDNIINEIDEEKSLMLERITAEMDGDFDKVCVINAKLFALKNKRIKDLEDKIEDITTHSLTLTDSRDVINKLIRMIAIKEYGGMFGKAFGELYKTVNYKLGINIKARDKKKSESYLHTLNEEECFKVEEMVRTWALDKGIDLNKELGLKTA